MEYDSAGGCKSRRGGWDLGCFYILADTGSYAANAVQPNAVSDIKDINGEKEIRDLLSLNVMSANKTFNPHQPVPRQEFVAWLVRTNNILRPEQAIRLADKGTKSSFSDVASNNPFFPYIQGLANAGICGGFSRWHL